MKNQFDELTKSMAQSLTRRAALKKFGVGLAGMALACFGLANTALAAKRKCRRDGDCGSGQVCRNTVCVAACSTNADCGSGQVCCDNICVAGIPGWCDRTVNPCCCYCVDPFIGNATGLPPCDEAYSYCRGVCGAILLC